ncbi:MAG TPA: VanZ family protein [Gemmatimonadales bacterium]|nr:VanZ family protein [Gemmatimonadales bacterium]
MPFPQQAAAARSTSLWCLVCGDQGGVDVLNNVLLFVPLGAGLTLLQLRVRSVVLTGIVISFAVESLQYLGIPGRDPSLSDLLTNTAGSWVGVILGVRHGDVLWPGRRAAGVLGLAGVLAWWATQAATAALLRPWAPSGELRAAWASASPEGAAYEVMVTSASVSGMAVEGDSTPLPAGLAERIRSGLVHLEIEILAGGPAPGWSAIFKLLRQRGRVMSVEAGGRDLVVQMPARARAWRLRSPALQLHGVLQGPAGTRLRLAAGERADTLWAVATSASNRMRRQQILSPSLGWSLLVPFHYAYGSEVPWLTGLWIVGWMVPIGYWTSRARAGWYQWPWFLLVLLVGLGIVPHLMGYSAVPWSEWVAGTLGLVVGRAGSATRLNFGQTCDSPFTSESS